VPLSPLFSSATIVKRSKSRILFSMSTFFCQKSSLYFITSPSFCLRVVLSVSVSLSLISPWFKAYSTSILRMRDYSTMSWSSPSSPACLPSSLLLSSAYSASRRRCSLRTASLIASSVLQRLTSSSWANLSFCMLIRYCILFSMASSRPAISASRILRSSANLLTKPSSFCISCS
jgi:hypothetical protein